MDQRPAGRALRRRRLRHAQRAHLGVAAGEVVLTRRLLALTAALAGTIALSLPLEGQGVAVWLDAAAAHARPPAGVVGADPGTYGILDARLDVQSAGPASAELAIGGGHGSAGAAATWLDGELSGELAWARRRTAAGVRGSVFGLDYADPFSYTAWGGTLEPRLALSVGDVVLTARGDFRRGGWRVSGDSAAVRAERSGPLAVTGGSLSLARAWGPVALELGGAAMDGALGGTYRGATGDLTISRSGADLTLGLSGWDTPSGDEFGYDAMLRVPLSGGVLARLQLGRSTTDPLYGTPGSFAASLGVSVRLGGASRAARSDPVVAIGDAAPGGRRVRFRLEAGDARSAAVSGDFTGWQPRAMHRDGASWIVELVVPPGFHHFGFLLDGDTWTVPHDAPGVEEDGWGRRNGSFVVEK